MFIVAALYHFTRFKDHRKLCDPLQNKCNSSGVTGSLLVAPEGINGTISGSRQGIDNVIEYIKTLPGCSNIEHKEFIWDDLHILERQSLDTCSWETFKDPTGIWSTLRVLGILTRLDLLLDQVDNNLIFNV